MKLHLTSTVPGQLHEVFNAFDEALFRYLLPPGAKLIRFDGSTPGDIVHLKLPPGLTWISEITRAHRDNKHCYFIDRGIRVPGPIRYWKHIHHVYYADEVNVRIEDEMEFKTASVLLDLVLYPLLYLAFLPRVFQYRRYFTLKNQDPLSTR